MINVIDPGLKPRTLTAHRDCNCWHCGALLPKGTIMLGIPANHGRQLLFHCRDRKACQQMPAIGEAGRQLILDTCNEQEEPET